MSNFRETVGEKPAKDCEQTIACDVFSEQDMSMRVSGGEENAAKSPGVADQKACKPSLAEPFPGMPVPEDTIHYYPTSPLLGLLACKELMPQVLEHEKALLVMKEHDYARLPYRPEILQLSYTIQPTSEEGSRGGEAATAIEGGREGEEDCFGANRTLLNCRNDLVKLRASVSSSSICEPVVTSHFREVVGLQVALLREQQEQLYHKDNELNAMRKEKEQLEARLERMERRLAILQKQSRSKFGYDIDSPQTPENFTLPPNDSSSTPRQTRLPRRDSLINSERLVRSRSSSVDCGSKRHRPKLSSRASTPVQDEKEAQGASVKRSHKRKLSDAGQNDLNAKKAMKQPKSPLELRTDKEYTGLGLPSPKRRNVANSNEEFNDVSVNHQNSIDGPSLGASNGQSENGSGTSTSMEIIIPSWRVLPVKASLAGDLTDCEDLTDEIFLKRHKKLEEDEKRRKRWDIQRARALREHEELLRKYRLKTGQSQEKKKEKVTTLLPNISEIEAIEVMDTVVVSAFGRPIPVMKPSEFDLPGFDLDVREAKDSVRTTRSRAKAAKPSTAESSAEES